MTLVAPVNLPYNVKTLWFDPNGIEISPGDRLVVETARGTELGTASSGVVDVSDERVDSLKSPLKPVLRVATDEDLERAAEMERLSSEAMPVFRELARETSEDMHPVSVEYMLDGNKAVFYFESARRIDFRELVRKLASRFHVRIDMKQIGVRDEARIVGGIAHCGQLVCCKRLGGEFKPVSIRMAKDQDLSLNSQKISGLCGRLMCCLRYEEQAYKEVKSQAPKVGAKAMTPEGPGKVTNIDVPTETISVRIGDEKPVKVPLSGVTGISEDRKSCTIEDDAWEAAVEAARTKVLGSSDLFNMPSFTGEDKVGSAKAVHNPSSKSSKGEKQSGKGRSRRSRKGSGSKQGTDGSAKQGQPKARQRRRSTKISADTGEKETTRKRLRPGHRSSGLSRAEDDTKQTESGSQRSKRGSKRSGEKEASTKRTRSRRRSGSGRDPEKGTDSAKASATDSTTKGKGAGSDGSGSTEGKKGQGRRRRRRRRSGSSDASKGGGAAPIASSEGSQGKPSGSGSSAGSAE